jgi:polysaccharide biosynthesis protein PslH
MKILYIIPVVQHPTMRGALRHYHFLRHLAERHSITLLALTATEVTSDAEAEIASIVDELRIFNCADPAPLSGGRFGAGRRLRRELRLRRAIREMRETLLELTQDGSFDVVLFHGKMVSPVIIGFQGLPIVVDFCDATSLRLREQLRVAPPSELPARLLRYAVIRRIERKLLSLSDHLAFISARDREAMLGAGSEARIVANGIDLGYWTRTAPPATSNCIVFTGVMDYAPNEDAALYLIDTLVPLLRPSIPDLEVLIVGRDPTQRILEAGARTRGVTVTGFVEDIRPYIEKARLYVAPIRYASGLQNKILEALAMEIPVVTTPVVMEGLRVDGQALPPVLTGRAAVDLAASIIALLHNEIDRSRLARDGREYVSANFEWKRGAALLEQLCQDAAMGRGAGHSEVERRFPEGSTRQSESRKSANTWIRMTRHAVSKSGDAPGSFPSVACRHDLRS